MLHAQRSAFGRRPMYRGWYGIGPDDRMLHAGAFNWTFTLGTGLLIGAIFSDRRGGPAARRREPDDFDRPPMTRPRDLPPPAPADQPETIREKRET